MNKSVWQTMLAVALMMTVLSGCDKATEALASSVSEADVKKEYMSGCAQDMLRSSNGALTQVQATDICDCTYEEAAKQYSDREVWKKAIIGYGYQKDPELEARIIAASEVCPMRVLGGDQ